MRFFGNIDIYITVIIAIVVSILGIFNIASVNHVMSAILGLIALISFSLLSNRNRATKMEKIIENLESSQDLAEKFLTSSYKTEEIIKDFKSSTSTYLWGVNFIRTIPMLLDSIESSLKNGHSIKIILFITDSVDTLSYHS